VRRSRPIWCVQPRVERPFHESGSRASIRVQDGSAPTRPVEAKVSQARTELDTETRVSGCRIHQVPSRQGSTRARMRLLMLGDGVRHSRPMRPRPGRGPDDPTKQA
jgi:hypothetical protein